MNMKNLTPFCIALALAASPALAQDDAPLTEEEALALVAELEEEQRPAWEIVQVLVDDGGLSVQDATRISAEGLKSPSARSYATMAGMCIAPTNEERAEDVGNAAAGVIEGEEEGAHVNGLVVAFEPAQCSMFRPRQQPAGLSFNGGPGIVTPGNRPSTDPSPFE